MSDLSKEICTAINSSKRCIQEATLVRANIIASMKEF